MKLLVPLNSSILHRGYPSSHNGAPEHASEAVSQFVTRKMRDVEYLTATNPLYSLKMSTQKVYQNQIINEIMNVSRILPSMLFHGTNHKFTYHFQMYSL